MGWRRGRAFGRFGQVGQVAGTAGGQQRTQRQIGVQFRVFVPSWCVLALFAFVAHLGPTSGTRCAASSLKVDAAGKTMFVSTEKVAGFMDAMVMPFTVQTAAALKDLKPGATIEFIFVVDGDRSRAENIRVKAYENLEQEPLELRRLQLLTRLAAPAVRREAAGRRPAGPRLRADRPEPPAGDLLEARREGRRRDVRVSALPEPRVLFPARQQFRPAPEALRRSAGQGSGAADDRHRPRARRKRRAGRVREDLDDQSRTGTF